MLKKSLFAILVLYSFPFAENLASHEHGILNWISRNHNVLIGPYSSKKSYLNVSVTIIPRGVASFDEVAGQISVAMAADIRWRDESLSWNIYKYGNVSSLILPEESVWKPKIALTNPIGRSILFSEDKFNVRVYPNGNVIWLKAGTVTTTCKPFVKYYPFDIHHCSIKLFPMGHIVKEIQLIPSIRMRVFENFGPWNLFNESVHSEILDVFSLLSFDFNIKRRPEFSLLSLCLPILLLGFLNSCVFLIPPESGERISYAITVLLSFAVFMTVISANMPKNSDPVPVLCYVLMVMMGESGVIVIFTIYGLRLHFRKETHPIPRLLHFTSKGLSRNTSPSQSISGMCTSDENVVKQNETCDTIFNKYFGSWKRVAEIYDYCLLVISALVSTVVVIYYVAAVYGNIDSF